MTQKDALDILKMGKNAFVTGPAGSGKTYVINLYLAYLRERGVSVGVTASTGIAATHMGGITIHSWSGLGIQSGLDEHEIAALADKPAARKIREAAVLVIDEVSMLHHFRLDAVDAVTRAIRKNDAPFGGLQVVLCGDFFQLPPVSRFGEPETHFVYRSEAWCDGKFVVCYLDENHRQGNDPLVSILNEIRAGDVSDDSWDKLRQRFVESAQAGEDTYPIHSEPVEAAGEPTRLYTHNIDVDAVNDRELSRADGIEAVYEMSSRGRKPLVDALKRSCLAPEKLRIKKGARVMCVKNNFEEGYVNGTLGVVVSCGPGVDPVIRTAPRSGYPDGELITIEAATWKIEDDGRVLAEITQYPLRLAWAITVHKSQGMSLDAVEVDLSKVFEPGMGYVALSRVRTLAGLSILGIHEHALAVHPDVLLYDRRLMEQSREAEAVLASANRTDIERSQAEWLARVAPLHAMKKGTSKGRRGEGGRAAKLSTYAQTKKLLLDKKSLREIAGMRDMAVETVISHIEHLLCGKDPEERIELADISYLSYEVSQQHFAKIEKALDELASQTGDDAPPLLSPIKSKLGPNVSFKDIRLARAILGYIRPVQ